MTNPSAYAIGIGHRRCGRRATVAFGQQMENPKMHQPVRAARPYFPKAVAAPVLTGALLLSFYPSPLHAQSADSAAKARAYHAVAQSCSADYTRFCPEGSADARNQVICLKAFTADLSLNCRKAVKAAR